MRKKIEIHSWHRKVHYELFANFDEPYFGIVADVDCQAAYAKAKKQNDSFFTYYLHKLLKALNAVEEFRYRIIDNEVYIFDIIHGSSTVARPDNTFGFSFIPYEEDYNIFRQKALEEIERVKNDTNLELNQGENIIHFTAIPWIKFTGLSHPRIFAQNQSIPKISTGKLTAENNKLLMPVGIHAHHGLIDGYHVGKFLDIFQELLNE